MANPLRLLSRTNHADTAIISTTSAAFASLPASNLKDDDVKKVWRSGGLASDGLIIDLGASVEIGAVALINLNFIASDQIYVRVSATDPTGLDGSEYNSGTIASGVDPVWAKFVHFIEPAVTGRYVRIALFKAGPEAGRLVIAPTWAPSRNMSFGWEPLWRDHSSRTRSLGGNEFVDIKDRQRGYRFTIRGLTEAEAQAQVDELNRLRGIGRDILVCRDKNSANLGRDTIWGLLGEPARQRHTNPDFYVVEFEVWERN